MMIDNATAIAKPDPDSHYRLRPCRCSSDNVAYVKILCGDGVERWRAECFDCGIRTAGYFEIMHDAQVAWNEYATHHVLREDAV